MDSFQVLALNLRRYQLIATIRNLTTVMLDLLVLSREQVIIIPVYEYIYIFPKTQMVVSICFSIIPMEPYTILRYSLLTLSPESLYNIICPIIPY